MMLRSRGRDHDVAGLEIAMHDAVLVGARERIEDLRHQVSDVRHRHRALLAQQVLQAVARHVLEREERSVGVGPTRVHHSHDVGVVDLRAGLHLAKDASSLVIGSSRATVQRLDDLQRDALPRRTLGGVVDHREPAPPEDPVDAVVEQLRHRLGHTVLWWWCSHCSEEHIRCGVPRHGKGPSVEAQGSAARPAS